MYIFYSGPKTSFKVLILYKLFRMGYFHFHFLHLIHWKCRSLSKKIHEIITKFYSVYKINIEIEIHLI